MRAERFQRINRVLDRRQPDLTVLMEKVHKTHNLSAILRNCDAVGVLEAHAVPPDDGLDVHHGTSAGTQKWIRIHRHTDIESAAAHLRERGFQLIAAHPSPDAVDYRKIDFTGPTALMMGTELYGASRQALALADRHVALPMVGMARSLNVSVATALLLYEAHRQRDEAGLYDSSRLDPDLRRETLFEWVYPELAPLYRADGRRMPDLDESGALLPE